MDESFLLQLKQKISTLIESLENIEKEPNLSFQKFYDYMKVISLQHQFLIEELEKIENVLVIPFKRPEENDVTIANTPKFLDSSLLTSMELEEDELNKEYETNWKDSNNNIHLLEDDDFDGEKNIRLRVENFNELCFKISKNFRDAFKTIGLEKYFKLND
ncbi:hypothetical protein M0811_05524 [Anaeramoeba ignava]|uniref:Uncharacterized protein n=1 Tax=Anaeramoeba ignava TaxID=1746090 RepID=A0A9Q0RGK0_ANAIG|nr:hypothetical protein M0811_05524 [Anaeramoeba ignava]